ncbi:MAG: hypothetical protein Q4E11_03430 [Corynebacterium sp.]|uniref:hypothetical protein n=1 Tax=Corynebacterium sp. TaxID=1720 RepID=UPI0026DC1113|nr:hypothetical protein [Corynebacterium sp.]MDO5029621.1 hypothetical protein [Corynebacterium sp.]
MFAPLPEDTYTPFPKPELDRVLSELDCRPVAAGYLADGDIITADMDAARYSWLV